MRLSNKDFLSNFINNISGSELTLSNSVDLLYFLLKYDPYNLTKFEFSFKIRNSQIQKEVRFLNLDCDSYSSKSTKFFSARVDLFKIILLKNKYSQDIDLINKIIFAFKNISETPMDLYFGCDILDNRFLFSFWFVFAGVKKDKSIKFWPYDFKQLIKKLLFYLDLKMPNKILETRILNFGIDIVDNNINYKLYYLCEDYNILNQDFKELTYLIDNNLENFNYFFFLSKMYNKSGILIKEKLFIEFLEDIYFNDDEKIYLLLSSLKKIKILKFNFDDLFNFLKKSKGKINLISFEVDSTITFYMRKD